MRKREPLPVRNPDFSQSSELPLFTNGLRFYPNLLNKVVHDDDKHKDKRDDIERWNDHNYYRG